MVGAPTRMDEAATKCKSSDPEVFRIRLSETTRAFEVRLAENATFVRAFYLDSRDRSFSKAGKGGSSRIVAPAA